MQCPKNCKLAYSYGKYKITKNITLESVERLRR
jgi:hypothetical protein